MQVTQKAANQDTEIRTLTKGDYFGEQVTDTYNICDCLCICFHIYVIVHVGKSVLDSEIDVAGTVENGHEDGQCDRYQRSGRVPHPGQRVSGEK